MPTYKNRMPMAPDTQVWRYTSLEAVIAMLRDSQMRLTRMDAFEDPFEGSVPKKQIDDQLPLFSGASAARIMMSSVAAHYPGMNLPQPEYSDPWAEMTRRRKAKTRSAHAICWAAGDESEAMWRLYCKDGGAQGVGVALTTDLSKLERSVARHDLFVSPVRYRHYHEGKAFTDELDPFMHKRLGFACEREVRLLKYDENQYLALTGRPNASAVAPAVAELPRYVFVDWSVGDVIDEITLSPYADVNYEEQVRADLGAIDPTLLDRVRLSVLSERRYAANF